MLLPTLVPALLFVAGVAEGAAWAAERSSPPVDVAVSDIRVDSVSLRGVRLTVDTELTRNRWPSVLLRGVDIRLAVGDEVLAEGESDMDPIRLRRGHTQTVSLPVTLHTLAALGSLGGNAANGELDLRLTGHVRTRVLFIPLSVPFRQRLVDFDLKG